MLNYVHFDPPMARQVQGGHRLSCVGNGVLIVKVEDQQGVEHAVHFPATIVTGLGRDLCSRATTAAKRVSMMIASKSYLGIGKLQVDLRTNKSCSTLTRLEFAIAPSSIATESVFTTMSGTKLKPEIVVTANVAAAKSSAQALDISSRKVSFFEQSLAVLPTTTDSGRIDTMSDSYTEFIKDKGYVDNKGHENTKNSRVKFIENFVNNKDCKNISDGLQHRNQEVRRVRK